MKKIVLILCICATCISVKAQEKKNFVQKLIDKGFMSSTDIRVGNGEGFTALDITVPFGYNFNKYINARIPVGSETVLFEEEGVRDWAHNGTIGLGLGIIPFRFEDDGDNGFIELYIATGTTYKHKYDWQYTYYDFGLSFANGKVGSSRRSQIGFGVRYYDARKSENRITAYISFGIRLN